MRNELDGTNVQDERPTTNERDEGNQENGQNERSNQGAIMSPLCAVRRGSRKVRIANKVNKRQSVMQGL